MNDDGGDVCGGGPELEFLAEDRLEVFESVDDEGVAGILLCVCGR